jgi:hypothetical protein
VAFYAPLAPTAVRPVVPLDVLGAGTNLLEAIKAVFALMDVRLPERVGLVPGGSVAFDGDQLTVNFEGITRGIPGRPDSQWETPASTIQYMQFDVYLLRQVSVVKDGGPAAVLPTPGQLAGDFTRLASDAANLWAAIVAIHASYAMVPAGVPIVYGPLESVGPEGGLSGSKCSVFWSGF